MLTWYTAVVRFSRCPIFNRYRLSYAGEEHRFLMPLQIRGYLPQSEINIGTPKNYFSNAIDSSMDAFVKTNFFFSCNLVCMRYEDQLLYVLKTPFLLVPTTKSIIIYLTNIPFNFQRHLVLRAGVTWLYICTMFALMWSLLLIQSCQCNHVRKNALKFADNKNKYAI